MKKDIQSDDKIKEGTLHEILLDIKYRLDHMEDMEADNRALIVKLIKQSNSIVKFLASVETEPVDELDFEDISLPSLNSSPQKDMKSKTERFRNLRDLLDEYMDKNKDLKEFEDELKKNKDMVTPGQIGES